MSYAKHQCSVLTCARQASAKGVCPAHYQRLIRGKPLDTPIRGSDSPAVITTALTLAQCAYNELRRRADAHGCSMVEEARRAIYRDMPVDVRNKLAKWNRVG